MSPKKRHARGFTLVELLTVIAVITLLVAMLVPSLKQARELANRMRCQSNMKVIGGACLAYIADYKAYPPCGLAPIVTGAGGTLTYGSPYVWWYEKPMLGQYMGCDIPHSANLPPKGTPVKCPSAAYSAVGVNADGTPMSPNPDNTWIAWAWNLATPGRTPPGSPMHRVYYRGPKMEEIINVPAQVPTFFDARADARTTLSARDSATPSVMYLCEQNRLLNSGVYSAGDHRHNGGINYLFADNHVQYIANPDLAYLNGFFLTPS